jgi:hypothetical protein
MLGAMLLTKWNVTEKVTSKYSDENLFSVTLSPAKPAYIGLELNQGLRGGIGCSCLLKEKTCFKSTLKYRKGDEVNWNPVH